MQLMTPRTATRRHACIGN